MESYMILVLGYHGSGKTTLLQNVNGEPKEAANEYTVEFQTNGNGPIRFLCVESMDNDITKSCMFDNRPIVLVGNKADSTRKRKVQDITADKELKELNRPFYEISARDKVHIRKPFLILARSLIKLPTLTLLDDPIPGHIDDHVLAENDVAEVNLVDIAAEHNIAVLNPGDISVADPHSCNVHFAESSASPTNKFLDNVAEANVVNVAGVPNPGDIPVGAAAEHNVVAQHPNNISLKVGSSALPLIKVLDKKPTLRIRGNDEELDWDLDDLIRNQRPSCCYC